MIRLFVCAVLVALLLTVAGCGNETDNDDQTENENQTEEVTQGEGDDTESEAEESTPTEPAATAAPEGEEENSESEDTSAENARVVSHELGEAEIPGTPERIVALEWTYAEDLLALGVQPAGVADIEGYNAWVDIEVDLDEDVTDVGTRQEPSLESIAQLEPDLIIGVQFRHEPIYDQLSDIAPTLIFNPYPEDESFSQFDEMEQTLLRIAEAVDREDEGQAVLDEMHATFDDVRADLDEAEIENQFVLAQAFTADSSPQMRLFIDSSMAVQILESIGLENAWDGDFDIYGFNTVGIEALTTVEDASFLYVAQDEDNPFQDQWADHPVWNDLTFVQEERVYPLGGETWLFGGPLSAEVLAEQVHELYLEAE